MPREDPIKLSHHVYKRRTTSRMGVGNTDPIINYLGERTNRTLEEEMIARVAQYYTRDI